MKRFGFKPRQWFNQVLVGDNRLILRSIKNAIFWKQTFDAAFQTAVFTFPKLDERRLDEKKFYWREQAGQRRGLSPDEAAFRALEDFADSYFQENNGRPTSQEEFERIATGLEQAAPFQDQSGQYRERRSFLSERWLPYLDAHRTRRDQEKEVRQSQLQEVTSHRFSTVEIDAVWTSLMNGDVTPAARSVWSALRVRRSAHDVAATAMMSLKNTMMFLIVFREHRIVSETQIFDQHLYSQNVPHDRSKLGEPLAALIKRLDT